MASAVFAPASRPAVRAMVRHLADGGKPLLRESLDIMTGKGRRRFVLVQAGRAGPAMAPPEGSRDNFGLPLPEGFPPGTPLFFGSSPPSGQ